MTSLSTIRTEQPSLEGRSVRDIVETTPELVNEVWCRKIFRQILQSLELQYAMQMPHRAITADTIVFHENGEPLLVPVAVGEPSRDQGADLAALAGIIHYAITHELMPTGPLHGRALEGYSDSLVTAVDRCMSPDPAQRPHSIDELRDILGIVALGPSAEQLASARKGAAAAAAAAVAPPPAPAFAATHKSSAPADASLPAFAQAGADGGARGGGLSRWQRWSLAVGGGAMLLAIALAMFAELRDSGSYDHIVLTLPQEGAHGGGKAALAQAPARAQDPAAGIGASDAGATASGGQAGAADGVQTAAPGAATPAPPPALPATAPLAAQELPAAVAPMNPAPAHNPQAPHALAQNLPAARAAAAAVPPGGGSYRLRVQPWGVVYVDGVDQGASPPLKRLALAPGRHTLRVANPAYPDRVLEVDTARGDGIVTVNFNDDGN